MNVVILMGRMVRDPELKYTSGGKAFNISSTQNKRWSRIYWLYCLGKNSRDYCRIF